MKNHYKRKAGELLTSLEVDYPLHAKGLEANLDSSNLVELVLSIDSQLEDAGISENDINREFMQKWFVKK
jgi:hypothetical protein